MLADRRFSITSHRVEKANGFSVVDRTGKTYEIGSATSSDAYKNWLGNSIGSGEGYYHDSTNTDGLKKGYDEIFKTIKEQVENGFQSRLGCGRPYADYKRFSRAR